MAKARKRKAADEEDVVEAAEEGDDVVDDDEAAAFSTANFLDPNWRPPAAAAKSPGDRKVTNKYIPLFPDATKSPKQHAASIKIYKTNPPNEGFKGIASSPETVDENYIAGLWGDGRYKLELLDQAKNVLRVRDDVVVSVGVGNGSSNGHKNGTDVETILARVTDANEKAMQKILEQTESRLVREHENLKTEREAERQRAKEHSELSTGLMKSEAEQLRLHYAAQAAQSEAAGRMMMAMMMQGHAQTMQMMMGMQQQQASRSDPLLFLRVYQEGQNNSGEDGADKVTGNIVKGLEALRGVAGAPGGNLPGAPADKKLPAANGAANGAAAKPGAKEKEVTKEELREIILLKRAAKVKGVALMDLVSQAKAFYADPNQPITEEVDDDEIEDDADAETPIERARRLKARKKAAENAADASPTEQPDDDVDGEGPPDA